LEKKKRQETHSLSSSQINCPFPDCKAVFDTSTKSIRQCTFSECYECRRGFCIACQNHWHPGTFLV
ncbi:hypothetical protein BD560DRAFT_370324, partial [Blakeslea trispora]